MYLLLSTFPSSLIKGPKESHVKQPQTITPPPPCLTVGTTHSMSYLSFGSLHTRALPSFSNRVKRDSSLHITFFQSSAVHSRCSRHHCIRSFLFFGEISGFRAATRLLYPDSYKARFTVHSLTAVPVDWTKLV